MHFCRGYCIYSGYFLGLGNLRGLVLLLLFVVAVLIAAADAAGVQKLKLHD